jgi:hypothetical protein
MRTHRRRASWGVRESNNFTSLKDCLSRGTLFDDLLILAR